MLGFGDTKMTKMNLRTAQSRGVRARVNSACVCVRVCTV